MPIRKRLPPCPDPEKYIAVETKKGVFWRKKRGMVKPVELNSALTRNAEVMGIVSPISRRIIARLEPYTLNLAKGAILSRMNALLLPAYKKTGKLELKALEGFDVQEVHVFDRLVHADYETGREGRRIWLDVKPWEGCIQVKNRLVTGYFFEAVLLHGNAEMERGLQAGYEKSGYYPINRAHRRSTVPDALPPCRLEFILPDADTPFILFFKVSCLEGNEMAAAGLHYGMKVVATGPAGD